MSQVKARYILGFDPSLDGTGYAVLDCRFKTPRVAEVGTVKVKPSDPHNIKLAIIAAKVKELRARYGQGLYGKVFLERGFTKFNNSTQATFKARGALESELAGLEVIEYTPPTVKLAVAGHGKAEKSQVAAAVAAKLGIENNFETEDESDALAVAYVGYKEEFLGEVWT